MIDKSIILVGTRKDLVEIYWDGYRVIEFKGVGKLTLEDLTLHSTNTGLDADGGRVEIRNVRVALDDGAIGIGLYDGAGGFIQDSEVYGDGYDCIQVSGPSEVTLERNILAYCSIGLLIEDGASAWVYHNEIWGNHHYGILVEHATAIIEDNQVTGNGTGVDLSIDAPAEIRRNDCSQNGDYGIIVNRGNPIVIEDNTCNHNGYTGISLDGETSGPVQGNECGWNDVNGIDIADDSHILLGSNDCHDNGDQDIADWRDN